MADSTPATAGAIFLSYAREDADVARRIADGLRAGGVEVWFDQNELRGGDEWDAKIKKQIRDCALFVAVISAQTQRRREGYFRREWHFAVERTLDMARGTPFLLPVVVDETTESAALVPEQFMRVQWTRLPQGASTPQFGEQVKRLLGPVAVPVVEAGRSGTGADPRGAGPATHVKPRWSGWAWGGLTAVIIGAVVALSAGRKAEPPAVPPKSVTENNAAMPSPTVPARPTGKSIAVLPFANMSEEKDAAFFADGIHEDILTNLALLRELHVVSRTSVMQYRATTKPIGQIARELGVAYVLEGSVRRAGHKVRVTGQLIHAATDAHVWAKNYDRDLTDIFALQSELAQAIAGALSAALSPEEKTLLARRPTENLAAYDLYLRAHAWTNGNTSDLTRAQAEQLLAEAVKLDPNFAAAWGNLAFTHVLAVFDDEDHSPERLAKAKTAIEVAARLAPGDPEVVEMLGNYHYYGFRDYARAAEHYQRLLLLRPNSAMAYAQLGLILRRQARWDEALASLRHALQFDPRNLSTLDNMRELLMELRRYEEVLALSERVTELADGDPLLEVANFYPYFLARGSTREGDAWVAGLKPSPGSETKILIVRRGWARFRGDWAQAVRLDREHPDLDAGGEPRWRQEFAAIVDLTGNSDLPAARARAEKLAPEIKALLDQQPANAELWRQLAWLHALRGESEPALRCARQAVTLVPEATDAVTGPENSVVLGQVFAWTGDKERALAELARLLRLPFGANVHEARIDPGWLPLRGDPRFEALLKEPGNNAPRF